MSLKRYRDQLSKAIETLPSPTKTLPRIPDPYIARSALQKALRRGDVDRATQAAVSLSSDPQRLWRGLAVTVFEDFGSLNTGLLGQVVGAASSKRWRDQVGGDLKVVTTLIKQLCTEPRDRRVDEAYMFAGQLERQPLTRSERRKLSGTLIDLLDEVQSASQRCERPVSRRSFKTVLAKDSDAFLSEMLETERMDPELFTICLQGRKTTQCLLPVLYPLLKDAAGVQSAFSFILQHPIPAFQNIYGAPSYALDGYTQPGREALSHLQNSNRELQAVLAEINDPRQRLKTLSALLFVVEGGVCTEEISDPLYDELKHVSVGRWSGLPAETIPDAIEVMRTAIPELNEIRERVYAAYVP